MLMPSRHFHCHRWEGKLQKVAKLVLEPVELSGHHGCMVHLIALQGDMVSATALCCNVSPQSKSLDVLALVNISHG